MLALGLPIALTVVLVIHIIRTGRNQLWLWAVVLLPLAGSVAYIVAEILPELMGNSNVRRARANVAARLDPEKELRAATQSLEIADTVANRLRLADAFSELGRHTEALPLYEAALARAPGEDPRLKVKTARAAFEANEAPRARELLDQTPPLTASGDEDRRKLLDARVREALGDHAGALALLAAIADRVPGNEARCRYAGLLLEAGRAREARTVLEDVEKRARQLTRAQRAPEREMYTWADAKLAELRA